jgi:heptosyltransferase II
MKSSTEAPRKILVRGVNWLGDAVMTTPSLQRLREARPNDSITLLTASKLAELWKGHPAINEIIPFSDDENVFTIARRLREHRFDIALVFPNSFRSAFECWLARIPVRIGYPANGRSPLLTQCVPHRAGAVKMRKRSVAEVRRLIKENGMPLQIPATAHQIHHYLQLTSALGASLEPARPQIRTSEEEIASFEQKFQVPQTSLAPVFGLNAGAEYGPAKRWPAEAFIGAAVNTYQATNCSWLILGGANDRELASRITAEINSACASQPAINTAGRTTLRELCAGLARCSVVLTNDSGPMHLAAAVGARVVVPFGSTSPELTGPGLPGHDQHTVLRSAVPCAPCFRRECPIDLRCLRQIEVSEAVAAVLKLHSAIVIR